MLLNPRQGKRPQHRHSHTYHGQHANSQCDSVSLHGSHSQECHLLALPQKSAWTLLFKYKASMISERWWWKKQKTWPVRLSSFLLRASESLRHSQVLPQRKLRVCQGRSCPHLKRNVPGIIIKNKQTNKPKPLCL